ncbi:MAG: hypothetical protein J0G98_13435 [Terrimonas ferruginea]|uniref:DUF6629 family protein n=1 Tax=Terrimonas ferruginea TaxID=249 RepID=UPI00092714C4|nr:DUF6629 family protein [Terrimonas ferruginea]MBN8784059.1 hypothetical protein [Terrimonas ferruginea]OJW41640.1 MAG: hypothetical protein BGO56_17430 [Sphingobacteriales bacterium 48-107]
MCFSAEASFGAGIVLAVIGVATIRQVRHPSQILFASIPLLFAVQQLAEGVLWKILPDPSLANWQVWFTYLYLLFALVVWPLWVPLAILRLEKESYRKNIQRLLVAAGVLVGIYLGYCLFTYPVDAAIAGYHVAYHLAFPPDFQIISMILYGMATVIPTFFSPVKRMWVLGLTVGISYIISAIFYDHYVLSVWCFFASVISLSIYIIMREVRKDPVTLNSVYGIAVK